MEFNRVSLLACFCGFSCCFSVIVFVFGFLLDLFSAFRFAVVVSSGKVVKDGDKYGTSRQDMGVRRFFSLIWNNELNALRVVRFGSKFSIQAIGAYSFSSQIRTASAWNAPLLPHCGWTCWLPQVPCRFPGKGGNYESSQAVTSIGSIQRIAGFVPSDISRPSKGSKRMLHTPIVAHLLLNQSWFSKTQRFLLVMRCHVEVVKACWSMCIVWCLYPPVCSTENRKKTHCWWFALLRIQPISALKAPGGSSSCSPRP